MMQNLFTLFPRALNFNLWTFASW